MNRIVTGLLHAPESDAARMRAYEIAAGSGGTVHIVAGVAADAHEQDSSAGYQMARDELQARLDEEVEQARQDHGIGCVGHLVEGASKPSRAILDVAEAVDADLIVIGIRQRSRVGKLVLGSNAQDILLGASVGVLCVKAEDDRSGA